MSHFSVLVVTDEVPTDAVLTQMLDPYHEFECTGRDDQYVQEIDVTEKIVAEYNSQNAIMVIERPDGSRFYAFDDDGDWVAEVKVFDTDEGLILPEGWAQYRDLPANAYMTLLQFGIRWSGFRPANSIDEVDRAGIHKYGYSIVMPDGSIKFVDRTNPNKKWDWWVVGGRWADTLKTIGNFSGFGSSNSAKRSDVDVAEMARRAREERSLIVYDVMQRIEDLIGSQAPAKAIELALRVFRDHPDIMKFDELISPDEVFGELNDMFPNERFSIDDADCVMRISSTRGSHSLFWNIDFKKNINTLAEWIDDFSIVPVYAVLDADGWKSKGTMGWFGCSSGEADDNSWTKYVNDYVTNMDGDKYVTIVDCHI